ncbi:MAG: DUF2064 domain-containing protein [Saprospiraceae bacterium]|nr:DUF2064 domain-containing protein [Saprospiraceae bacterium]
MNKNNTAILLFSRTATIEAREKPLAEGKQASESVAGFLIQHVKRLAVQTQLPVFFISEKEQRGISFGERFANAFEDIFQKGFERVVAIGNDCLFLTKQDILSAAKALETTPSVLGATEDGGAYLIGFQKNRFQKQTFENIAWQSENTFLELVDFFKSQDCSTYFLSKKSDIDIYADWHKTLQKVGFYIKKQLIRLFDIGFAPQAYCFLTPINALFLNTFLALRAPPVFLK